LVCSELDSTNSNNVKIDKSGTCALVLIIIEDTCYLANLGDSRALLSENCSRKIFKLSRDHKPDDPEEKLRIEMAGGKIYQ
jgi:protein phosphatase 2C family protein 2/3